MEEALTPDTTAIPSGPADPANLRRRTLSLAWPIIAENFLETLLGAVDTALVGHLGAAATAGVGAAQQIQWLLISVLSAVSIGSAVLVAQAVGARDLTRASNMARQSLIWSLIISIPLAIGGYFISAPLIRIFGVNADVAAIGTEYLQVTFGTVVVLVALLIGSGAARGAGDSRTPMIVTAIANVINIALAYGLINGVAGLPQMGPVGSAWATFISRGIALMLLVGALWRGRNGISIATGAGAASWMPDLSVVKRVLKIGTPAAVEQVSMALSFLVLTLVVATLGTETLAAQRIIFAALSFSFLPGLGFSIAATALVGQSVGARRVDDAQGFARIATLWAVIWMGITGVIGFLLAPQLLGLFTTDQAVIDAGVPGMRIVALSMPLWGIMMTQSGALRGTGNTQLPLLISSVSSWSAVLIASALIFGLNGGLAMVWTAFLITTPVACVFIRRAFAGVIRRMFQQTQNV